jgi:hypothetical protein
MAKTRYRRAHSVEEFDANMKALHAIESTHFRPYVPQPGDVFIASWAKSGTTMIQQMFHQLRMAAVTGAGDMDFDDISRMTPWEDTALMLDFDMNAPQRAAPRGFKSHREYERLPAGMRYVVTLRDPNETFISFYRFFDGWHIERGALTLEEFFPLWVGGGPGGCDYYTHLLSWWARRDDPDTLLANYRWAAKNRQQMIQRLASLCEIELTEEVVALVEEYTSRKFMHTHKEKFDDAMVCAVMEDRLGIPANSDSSKVQAVGSDSEQVPTSIAEQMDAMWGKRIEPVTGHKNFASLASELGE